ncbi:MAG: hypothetical protein PHG03_00295 [Bacilli bacterium]|nr:hypothetical protein [Bacilli bacterium]
MLKIGEEFKEIIEKIIDTSAIMVKLGANTTINITTAWDQYSIPFDTIMSNLGDKFTLNSDGSISYSGNKNLKVEVNILVGDFGNHSQVYPTSSFNTYYQDYANSSRQVAKHSCIGKSNLIRGIIRTNGTGNLMLYGGNTYCYMIVEEI